MKNLFFVISLLFFISACEESIHDGRIPEKYRSEANQYVGTFFGLFEKDPTVLKIEVKSDGLVSIQVTKSNGTTKIVKNCDSEVGPLISIEGDRDTNEIKVAKFKFNGRLCGLIGDTIEVHVRKDHKMTVRIAAEGYWDESRPICSPDYNRPTCPDPIKYFVITKWLSGEFQKK